MKEQLTVAFRKIAAGRCLWCKKEKAITYEVTFSDKSFDGPLCKADLLRAIEAKTPNGEPPPLQIVV